MRMAERRQVCRIWRRTGVRVEGRHGPSGSKGVVRRGRTKSLRFILATRVVAWGDAVVAVGYNLQWQVVLCDRGRLTTRLHHGRQVNHTPTGLLVDGRSMTTWSWARE